MSAVEKLKIINEVVECENYIGGKFQGSLGEKVEVVSPYTGQIIGTVPFSTASEVDQAIMEGTKAFQSWKKLTYKERARFLFNFRDLLQTRIDHVSETVALESGKTIAEAKAGIMKGLEVVEYALSLQNKVHTDGFLEVSKGVSCKQIRTPMGVCVGITPFNFPAMVPMWLFPISLACGNTFIWKPSEKVPLTAQAIAQIMSEAGFPNGVFQTINGGKDTVDKLIESNETKVISFVGSSPVAKAVFTASSTHGKRSLALGGAKNHIILCEDADPEVTTQGIVDSFTGCAGQRCMAASLLLTVGKVDALIDGIVQRARSVELGSDMGAIIDERSLKRMRGIIERAKEQGASILVDGTKATAPEGCEKGFWIGPTIIDGASEQMECVQEEIFGPVLTICRVNSLDEALERENRHAFGDAKINHRLQFS